MIVKIDQEQHAYVTTCEEGIITLGFAVCKEYDESLRKELGIPLTTSEVGTMDVYKDYLTSMAVARLRHKTTGFK